VTNRHECNQIRFSDHTAVACRPVPDRRRAKTRVRGLLASSTNTRTRQRHRSSYARQEILERSFAKRGHAEIREKVRGRRHAPTSNPWRPEASRFVSKARDPDLPDLLCLVRTLEQWIGARNFCDPVRVSPLRLPLGREVRRLIEQGARSVSP